MSFRPMIGVASSASRSLLVFAVIAGLALLSSVGVGVRLLAGTLVAIGGNSNPSSASMIQELGGDPRSLGSHPGSVGVAGHGYLDPTNPASPYYGYDFQKVGWPSQIPYTSGWDGKTTFEQSQRQGLLNVQDALDSALLTDGPVTVAGYSSGANVVVREMRYLQSIGSPDADRLSFLLFASMNRPNGGIAQRFPGLFVPLFNVKFDGSTPTDTPYKTTDVSWEYDPISDFPNYPLNLLADLNALLGFGLLHSNYFPADMTGPRARPDYTDPDSNITYVTLAAPELPLLVPFKMLGVPKQLLDLVRPALKLLVDLGYDRSINPGVPTPASLSPTPQRLIALPFQLLNAVGVGIRHALNPSWDKVPTVSDETADQTALAAATPTALPQAKTNTRAAQSAAEVTAKTATRKADTTTAADDIKSDPVEVKGAKADDTTPAATGGETGGADTATSAEADKSTASASDDAAPPARRHPAGTHRPHRTKTPAADSATSSQTPDADSSDANSSNSAPPKAGGKHGARDRDGAAGDRVPRSTGGAGEGSDSDKKAA